MYTDTRGMTILYSPNICPGKLKICLSFSRSYTCICQRNSYYSVFRPGQYPSSVQDDEKELDSTAKKDSRPQSEKESRSTSEKSSRQSTGNRSQRSAVSARSKVSVGSNTEKNATGRKSQQTSDRRETTARKSDKEESSDTSESVPSAADRRIHREGHDRPKSRAGHSADGRS